VIPTTSPQDARTEQLVTDIRHDVVPVVVHGTGVRTYVGGVTAAAIDTSSQFSRRLPWVIAGVVLLSFLLLMSVFPISRGPGEGRGHEPPVGRRRVRRHRPVFQWGWLGGVIGIGKTGPIDPWIR